MKRSALQVFLLFMTAAVLNVGMMWHTRVHYTVQTIVPSVVLSYIASDIISGTVHWLLDNYGSTDTPIIGHIIADFREHHTHPNRILTHTPNERSGVLITVATVLNIAMHAIAPSEMIPFVWMTSCYSMLSNEMHAISHATSPTTLQRTLMWIRLANSRRSHKQHHVGNHDENYCILNGSMNAWFNRIDLWKRLERLIYTCTGVRAASWPSL